MNINNEESEQDLLEELGLYKKIDMADIEVTDEFVTSDLLKEFNIKEENSQL